MNTSFPLPGDPPPPIHSHPKTARMNNSISKQQPTLQEVKAAAILLRLSNPVPHSASAAVGNRITRRGQKLIHWTSEQIATLTPFLGTVALGQMEKARKELLEKNNVDRTIKAIKCKILQLKKALNSPKEKEHEKSQIDTESQ